MGGLDEDRVDRLRRCSGASLVVVFSSGLVVGLVELGLIFGPGWNG